MLPQVNLQRPAVRPNRAASGLAWWRIGTAAMACALVSTAAAQSPKPSELAAKALASAPVQALLSTQAQPTKANASPLQKEYDAQLAAIRQAILDATMDLSLIHI